MCIVAVYVTVPSDGCFDLNEEEAWLLGMFVSVVMCAIVQGSFRCIGVRNLNVILAFFIK
jgi:hypothetical protein